MSISFQALNDTVIALITTVGIAVALSLAFLAAGAFAQRSRTHVRAATRAAAAPSQQPTQSDDARELVLR